MQHRPIQPTLICKHNAGDFYRPTAPCRVNLTNTKTTTLFREGIPFRAIAVICNEHSHYVDPALKQC